MPSRTKKRKSTKRSTGSRPSAKDYQVVVRWSDEDQCYLGEIPALEGCVVDGDDAKSAMSAAYKAAQLWLDDAAKHDDPIPPPTKRMSGKMTVRLPASLHQEIARRAEREGVSINQWINNKLAS